MTCNAPTQSETGGKFLHLKICLAKIFASVATSNDLTITGHNAKINDVVKFDSVALNTVINITDYYYIVAIVDVNKVEISNTKGGTAIVMDATGVPTGAIFVGVGGLRSKEFAFASEAIDITNHDSEEWKLLLDDAGQRSASISGSGVFGASEAFTELQTQFLANHIVDLMFIDLKSFKAFLGFFKVTQLSASGDYNAEGQYSFSAESSGPVSIITV
jgi:TP901-1 family phage major tail protein